MIAGDSYNTLNLYIFLMGPVFCICGLREKCMDTYNLNTFSKLRYSVQFGPFSLIALDGRKLRQMGKEI